MRDLHPGLSALPKRKCWDFSAALSASISVSALGTKLLHTLELFRRERVAMHSFSSSNFSWLFLTHAFAPPPSKAGRKDAVEFRVFQGSGQQRGQDHVAEGQQPFTLTGVSDVGKLMGRKCSALLRQNLPVSVRLIEHINEVRILKIFDTSGLASRSLTFCVRAVGIPLLTKTLKFQRCTPQSVLPSEQMELVCISVPVDFPALRLAVTRPHGILR